MNKIFIVILLILAAFFLFGCTGKSTAIADVKAITIVDINGFTHNILLGDLNDVELGGLISGDALVYDGPSNTWVPGTVSSSDEKVKISAADSTTKYLENALAAGSNITLTKLNPGANEQLRIDSSFTDTNCAATNSCPYIVYLNNDVNKLKHAIYYADYNGITFPTVTAQTGKFLSNNGTILQWIALPDGNIWYEKKSDLNTDINAALSIYSCPTGWALQKLGTGFTCMSVAASDTNWQTSWSTFDANMKSIYVELDDITYNNKWFVSSEIGSDDNNGLSEATAFATISKAIESCGEDDLINVLDSATYIESVIIPTKVTLNMPFATLKGEISLSTMSRFFAKNHAPSGNGQTMVSCIGTAGASYNVSGMNSTGYSNIIHFKPATVGGYIIANTKHITVGSSTIGNENILVYSSAGSTGINIATDGNNFSSDKALNYGYPADLVYGDTGYAQWYTDVVGYPITITYDIGTGTTVGSYKMKATSSGTRMPKNWTVHGQLAGGGWVLLDTQTGILWSAYEEKEFTIGAPGSYDEYRITVASSEHATRLQIDDIGFWAGVASVGGDVMITSDLVTLGDYAQGILAYDFNQRVVTNINNVYQTADTEEAIFIDINAGAVSHRGNVVTVDNLWNKTGGILIWEVVFDSGTKTGVADYYNINNKNIIAGTGITITEGTGANENSLVVTNTALSLDTNTQTAGWTTSDGNWFGLKLDSNYSTSPIVGRIERNDNNFYATIPSDNTVINFYPTQHTSTYVKATSTYIGPFPNYLPENATDPSKSITGDWTSAWVSGDTLVTNQSFNIDLGETKIVDRIYYENGHQNGGKLTHGAKNFTFWGSNTASAFANTTYATDTNWVQITTNISAFEQHVAVDASDPKYVILTNTTAYRYYRFKIADNWGSTQAIVVRRFVLQDFYANNRKNIVLSEGRLTEGRIPIVGTSGNLVDFMGLTFIGNLLNVPRIVGGSGTTDSLTLQSTTGVATSGADILFKVGNNGATNALTVHHDGNVGVGNLASNPTSNLQINSSGNIITSTNPLVGIWGGPNSLTYQKMLSLNTTTWSGNAYGAGVAFLLKSYNPAPGAPYNPNSQLTLALKSTASSSEVYNVNVMTWRDNGNVGIGTTEPTEKLSILGNINIYDTNRFYFGDAKDASIKYDGANMIINPKEVGTGKVNINGDLQVDGNYYANGVVGWTGTCDLTTATSIVIKNGLITECS